jgi:tetratricopeptide (TPR) repeat protein
LEDNLPADTTNYELTYQDLLRFEETLKPPFRRAFESGRVDLLPAPQADPDSSDPLARAVAKGHAVFDERAGRLVIPLITSGPALGLLVVWGVKAEQLAPQVAQFLSALMETALEMVRLRLAAETDPLTGFLNEMALEDELIRALVALTPAEVQGRPALDRQRGENGLSLLAFEPEGMNTLLERYGRRFGEQAALGIARKVRELGEGAKTFARVGNSFLVLIEGGGGTAREMAGRLRRSIKNLELPTPDGGTWQPRLHLGVAAADARTYQSGGSASEAAALFKGRALRAKACASRMGMDDPLFFGEIVDKAGRITEVMPLDRVRLDLGRLHGLTEGERFQVVLQVDPSNAKQHDKDQRPTGKAEIMVVSVAEEESVAEVVALHDPTWTLRPGDGLRRSSVESEAGTELGSEENVDIGGRAVKVVLDEVTELACHRSLMALFSALCETESGIAATLIRVEGMEGLREEAGSVGADALMKSMAGAARKVFAKGAHLGRYAPDTLGILMPGADAETAQTRASELITLLADTTQRALRAGVAVHPCLGFEASDILDNAAKALVHAGFLDPGAVVPFDAVSLNISGDTLFAQGRISEAVAEYERGLGLTPDEPNLLNSLGVSYGHLGQMDKAMSHFEKALEAAPDDFMAHYNLGYALMGQGRLAEARQRLEASLALEANHADTIFQLARLAQGEGRLAEALDLFTRAAEVPECRPAVHRHLGEALAASGQLSEAEDAFHKAVKVNPNDAAALASLAEMYLHRQANLEIVLSLTRKALELEPGAARHMRIMAKALISLERWKEAAALLEQAVIQHPKDPFLALQTARLLAARNESAAARDEYIRALSLEPNLEEARAGLAALEESEAESESAEPEPEEDSGNEKPEPKGIA